MSIQDTHKWAKEKMINWDGLTKETCPWDNSQKKLAPVKNLKFTNDSFFGDVAIREGDLFFHFFPAPNPIYSLLIDSVWVFNTTFLDVLTASFIAIFKHEDRVFVDFVPELQSYVIRCAGFGDNPIHEELIDKTLINIKDNYERP